MLKKLNDKKLMNNEDNLINKFNTNNPFSYNFKDKIDKKQNSKDFNIKIDTEK